MFSAWLWAVTLFIFFGVIVLISFSAMHRGSNYEEARARARMEKLKTAREEAAKALTTYGWIDKAKGAAHIPIERAMELTLADLRMKKPTAANPIATPAPAAPEHCWRGRSRRSASSKRHPEAVFGRRAELHDWGATRCGREPARGAACHSAGNIGDSRCVHPRTGNAASHFAHRNASPNCACNAIAGPG